MGIDSKEILDVLNDINDSSSALDMLLEFEGVLDANHLYAYQNWDKGEVVEGPTISRYWVEVKLMYPYKMMPDPEGAMRLIRHGCYVFFQEDEYITSVEIKTPDDMEPTEDGTSRKPKKRKSKVWIVKISMPRELIDEFNASSVEINGIDVDMTDITDAYDDDADSMKELNNEEGEDNNDQPN